MDLGQLGLDNFFCSNSSSSNSSFAFENVAEINKQKCYGFGFLKQERGINEDELREFKAAKTCGEAMLKFPLQRSSEGHQQMLSFSSPNNTYHHTSNAFGRNTGYGMSMQGGRGSFTPSQWMELEHQALIYKYITANVPIPPYLLNPIRKAFESAGFPALRSTAFGWGGFQLGFANSDPEPGRCRRTDGKKWRCSRDAVADQKYCERHINRGRHRSRKPVEGQPGPGSAPTTSSLSNTLRLSNLHPPNNSLSGIPTINRLVDKENGNGAYEHATVVSPKDKYHNAYEQEFGLVCSDSLVNPLNTTSSLRQFMDEWPKTQLSISIPMDPTELEMGLGVGSRRQPNWISMGGGGPLGEVLAGECNARLASSPTGVLQSNNSASAASSPGLINPSLPAL